MPLEIERKFLVENESWRSMSEPNPSHFVQGYLALGDEATPEVRIRIARSMDPATGLVREEAFLTTKSRGHTVREEIEVSIPVASAREVLAACICKLEKTRYRVPEKSGLVFEVDVYHGALEGLVMAEIELSDEHAPFDREVGFLGEEVSSSKDHKNARLAIHGKPSTSRPRM